MALVNLTDAQVKDINAAMALFSDPTFRQAFVKSLDVVAGASSADITALEAGAATAATDINTVEASVAALNAWATALATKLNADAGVTDVNYDTNPQA